MPFTESTFEQAIIQLFEVMGYIHIYAPVMHTTYCSKTLIIV